MKRLALVLALIALPAGPAAAQQGPRIAHQPSATRPYSAAVQVGNMYWLSGKVGATAETRAMTEGRTAAETHNVMRAFQELLGELGMDLGDVVSSIVYLADIEDYDEMNEAYGGYFPSDPPARATVAVADLVGGAAIEISFVAVKN